MCLKRFYNKKAKQKCKQKFFLLLHVYVNNKALMQAKFFFQNI